MGGSINRMLKRLLFISMFVLLFLPVITSIEIPTLQRDLNQTLSIPCNFNGNVCPSSAVCNSTIMNPNGTVLYNNYPMDKVNAVFAINLTSQDLDMVGQYEQTVSCCAGVTCKARELPFQVTPSGSSPLTTGQSGVLLIVLGVMFFISIIFFIIGFRSEHIIPKMVGFSFGAIMVIIIVFYTMFMINEVVSGTPNLVTGYETFLFVMRIIGTVLILSMMVILFMVMVKSWKVKRGLIDR